MFENICYKIHLLLQIVTIQRNFYPKLKEAKRNYFITIFTMIYAMILDYICNCLIISKTFNSIT